MAEQRQLEIAFAVSLGQTSARRDRVQFARMFVVDHQVAEAHQFDCRDALVGAIKQMLHLRGQMLRKHLFDPFSLHRAGQYQQRQICRAARGHFSNAGGHE